MPAGGLGLGAISSMAGNIGAGATGLLSGITGFFQKKQGNKLLSQNPFPTEALPSEVTANQQIAQGAATQGMPSEQYQAAQKNIQRNQAAALNAATDRRSGVASIGAIQEGSNTAQGNLDAQSAEMKRQNIGQLLNVNNTAASWKDKLFDWNQRAKYEQNRQYGMSLVGAGNANMIGGADKLVSGLVGVGASGALSGSGPKPAATQNPYASQGTGLADTGGPGVLNPQSVAGSYSSINPNSYSNLIGN